MTRVLVLGYGSVLRGDDGAGWHAAEILRERLPSAEVLSLHQLTPELAEDLARADLAVFVDAAAEGTPGTVTTAPVRTASGPTAWTHHLTPWSLLGLAERLYGRVPEAWTVTVAAASTEVSETLSPEVEAALPLVVDEVLRAVRERAPAEAVSPAPAPGPVQPPRPVRSS